MSTTPAEAFVGYALTADYQDTYTGGVLAIDGQDFDVAAELEAGDGLIVTASPNLITALDQYDLALERVEIPADRIAEAQAEHDQLAEAGAELEAAGDLTVDEAVEQLVANHQRDGLAAIAEAAGLDATGTKREIAERIVAAEDQLIAAQAQTTTDGDGAGETA